MGINYLEVVMDTNDRKHTLSELIKSFENENNPPTPEEKGLLTKLVESVMGEKKKK
jgi:hypothetical protein